jgi:hypothetical protein
MFLLEPSKHLMEIGTLWVVFAFLEGLRDRPALILDHLAFPIAPSGISPYESFSIGSTDLKIRETS